LVSQVVVAKNAIAGIAFGIVRLVLQSQRVGDTAETLRSQL